MSLKPLRIAVTVLLVIAAIAAPSSDAGDARSHWWKEEPVRFFQTNLPENLSTLDAGRLVKGVADFGANTLLFNMGGIAAQYPTDVELHYRSRWLPEGGDLFGAMLAHAHARGLRVIGRFDLSKTRKSVFEAHPEWFFRRENGEPAIYNGLYSACINGGYYWEHAPKILTEALTRYAVDGVFFNMFGNPARDYDGVAMGPCHCDPCREKFEARHGRSLPENDRDPEYQRFLYESGKEVAANLGALIRRLRPNAALLTYIDEHTDVIIHESNTSVTRPLPLWQYSASDNVNRSLNSGDDKVVFNLCMSFVDYPWRFIHVSPDEVRLRLWQNLAHGAPPALVVLGDFDQEDKTSLIAARPIFAWHQAHEELYVGQTSAALVLLLYSGGGADYRGFFRMLTDCVEGGASVSFMHPLTRDRALAFWRRVAQGVAAGERALLIAEDVHGLCGTVQLVLDQPENQPHRADLAKMLVHRRARQQGLGAALMRAAETTARECGKTLLVLDTVTGSAAERLYQRLGWVRVGEIPDYALLPRGGLCATTVYFRDLG